MVEYFQRDGGNGFVLFSFTHVITLVTIFSIGVLIFLLRNYIQKNLYRNIIRYSLAVTLVISEISLTLWLEWTELWTIAHSLPLHLSSLSLFTSVLMLITKNFLLFEFTYFAGFGSATMAMLTPDIKAYTFPHFRYIHFFISHGGIVIACFFMIFVEQFKPTFKSIFRAFLMLNIYTGFIFIVNLMINGNYMYLMHKPTNPSIVDYLGPWPWYIVSLQGIALATFLLLYAPFSLNNWMKNKLRNPKA